MSESKERKNWSKEVCDAVDEFKALYPGVRFNMVSGSGKIYIEGKNGEKFSKNLFN